MSKILIINDCSKCYCREWIGGKPRCTHEDIPKIEPDGQYDWCPYPRCPSDKPFLDGCPLKDYAIAQAEKVPELEKKIKELVEMNEYYRS